MALIDIEYGSLASSETMNKNFLYLDNKIADTSDSILTSISSILSNIATLNARLNDMSENIGDTIENLTSTLEEYKTKTKLLVNKASMVPDWKNCASVSVTADTSYKVPSNGYLLVLPNSTAKGNLIINNTTVTFKNRSSGDDNAAELVSIPVYDGDIVSTNVSFNTVYFLPSKEVALEDF